MRGRLGRRGPQCELATLTITVKDLRNHNGDLIFGVFKSADGFPNEKAKSVNWQVKPAAGGDAVVFTAKLPPGNYAASVLHDENRNARMDRNALGVPLEGYGVTNNPKPALRQATFRKAPFLHCPKRERPSQIGMQCSQLSTAKPSNAAFPKLSGRV